MKLNESETILLFESWVSVDNNDDRIHLDNTVSRGDRSTNLGKRWGGVTMLLSRRCKSSRAFLIVLV